MSEVLNKKEVVENLFTPNSIRTFSGKYMNVFEPTPDMICIEDIAHALSMQCRFGGHLPKFYSVAQHSINCAHLVGNPKLKLEALLHDASEAYLLDIPRPIKSKLENYKDIENNLMLLIAEKFEFAWPLSKAVKEADETMLWLEWENLMLDKASHEFIIQDEYQTKKNFLSLFKYFNTLI